MNNIIALIIALTVAQIPATETVTGKFTSTYTDIDNKQYYQFKSNDDTVWWSLTETEIGFAPSMEKQYILSYCNNGTTKDNKPCDCIPEWECECEVYDDILLGVEETNMYPRTMTVTEIDRKSDLVTVTDFTGNEWKFFGVEDWQKGDICSCIMNDNGTENIKDDIITDVKYNGNVGGTGI